MNMGVLILQKGLLSIRLLLKGMDGRGSSHDQNSLVLITVKKGTGPSWSRRWGGVGRWD